MIDVNLLFFINNFEQFFTNNLIWWSHHEYLILYRIVQHMNTYSILLLKLLQKYVFYMYLVIPSEIYKCLYSIRVKSKGEIPTFLYFVLSFVFKDLQEEEGKWIAISLPTTFPFIALGTPGGFTGCTQMFEVLFLDYRKRIFFQEHWNN